MPRSGWQLAVGRWPLAVGRWRIKRSTVNSFLKNGASEDRRRIGESRSAVRERSRARDCPVHLFSARQGCDGQPPPTPKRRITHSGLHVHHSILVTLISYGSPSDDGERDDSEE